MSNNQQDLKDAANVGKSAYSDYSSGKGLSSDNKEKGEKSAQTLYKDYQKTEGSGGDSKSGGSIVDKAKNFLKK